MSRVDLQEIERQLKTSFSEVLGLPVRDVRADLSIETCGAWSSLLHLMLITEIERRFEVMFSARDVQELTSYHSLLTALLRRLGRAA